MNLLYLLERIRTPFLDKLFSAITLLGGETLFLAVSITVLWCVSKRQGYYLLSVGFFGIQINQFLKLLFRIPRPWVRDPNFTIVESARAGADGYSFPSGHTQNVCAILGCPARSTKSRALRIFLVLLILLTAFSRMYLGVHTLADVGVSLLIGGALVFGLYPVFMKNAGKPGWMYAVLAVLTALSAALVLFVELTPWQEDIDPYNLSSGMKNSYLLLGCSLGALVSYHFERKYIRYEEKAPLWAQVLKALVGLALVLALKAGLKPICSLLLGGHDSATALRYFLLVVFILCVWPLTFPWFSKGCPLGPRGRRLLKAALLTLLALSLLAAILFWIVTRDTGAAPISTDNPEIPLITPLGTAMISAHRAGSGIAPENTMMALKIGGDNPDFQVDFLEFDIHLTADGIPVLLHDATLDRTSNAAEHFGQENVDVGTRTLAELKELNMGETFVNDAGEAPFAGLRGDAIPDDLRIVTLEEALSFLESRGSYRYIIEIKDGGETGLKAADQLYATLEGFGCTQRAIAASFHHEVTAYLTSAYPDLPRSAGMKETAAFYIRALLNLNAPQGTFPFVALQIPTAMYHVNLATTQLVNYAHENGIAVQYWTINDAQEMLRLQSIGADAIITDHPDLAAKVLTTP